MFKNDIDLIRRLHCEYGFKAPLLDAGGQEFPTIADYSISANKALDIVVLGKLRKWPHPDQNDRYVNIRRPWEFIDPKYTILNPDKGDPEIECLPETYTDAFDTVILVSVFEHVINPYLVSDALFEIIAPGGYLVNSTPFLFPYHPSPTDNFRYSPNALKHIHERSGFTWIEGDFHINHSALEGIGDTNPNNYGAPQAIMASYALCQKR